MSAEKISATPSLSTSPAARLMVLRLMVENSSLGCQPFACRSQILSGSSKSLPTRMSSSPLSSRWVRRMASACARGARRVGSRSSARRSW